MAKVQLKDNKPLYIQIAEYIMSQIQSNTYAVGDLIPPERELTQQFDVSRVTVRKAIQELVQEGYLYRVQGKGTFVFGKNQQNTQKTNSIGVILDYSHKELESRFLIGIDKVLEEYSYSMTYKSTNNDYQKESETILRMRNEGVAGLIILPAEDQQDSTAIFDLKIEGFPFVLIDRRLEGYETDCVMSDNINGSYQATEHLIQLGHTNIGFIKREFTRTSSIKDRFIGYKNALKEYGMEFNQKLVFEYNKALDKEIIDERMKQFIEEQAITAVVAINDYVALDVVKMCRKNNIKIPEDLSIIGFDNLDVIKHMEIPLTSVAQFPEEIGYQAAKILFDNINADNERVRKQIHQIYYPTELVFRDSCQKL